ncbi:ABC transporter permease [Azospirillum isscasi]|uniref:ABC transporter permease n=1 Tax=Azospirillum isscasi TaxID=3053926 RepID=A0ABU0WIV5_9PROT|nr:ABC transporter permease [Azospirillum isscasi]MDQ2104145.1 ABC transporter permease [Azospirillum isscasi]
MPDTPMTGASLPLQDRSPAQPVRFRGGGFAVKTHRWAALLAFVLLIAVWESTNRFGLVSALFLPPPSAVASALAGMAQDGSLWQHLKASLMRIGVGWAMGTVAGMAVGFAMGIGSVARAVGVPLVSAFFPIPKIALLPLFILWFGIGEPSKFATIGFGVFFPTVIATYSAIDSVPRNLIRMAQSFGLPWASILRKIVLPGALPGILAGFRITASIALILVVAAEMIGAEYGIGAFVLTAGNLMLTDQLLAGVLVLSLLGLTIGTVLSILERRLLKWR